jgi:uncharacterized protein
MASLLHELHPRRFFLETWAAIDEEAAAERGYPNAPYDYRPLVVLAAAAVLLSLMHYFGKKSGFDAFVAAGIESGRAPALFVEIRDGEYADLFYRYWWAGSRVLGYLLVPMAIVRFGLGGRLREHGLSTRGLGEHAGTYALAFVAVFACVIAVSFDEAFVRQYPFYEHAGRSLTDLLLWEIAYAAQFFSLEFFYRGFLVNTLRPALGSSAIFVMTVPYCMVHFGKPLGETLGAVFAGVFLGTLALRTRSIWSGFFLHVGIAISMDVASLLQTDRFPTRW